jgi:hypothetical protein
VPMLTCGLVRSNFAFATGVLLWTGSFLSPDPTCHRERLTRGPKAAVWSPWEDHTVINDQAPVAFAMISFATLAGTSA